MTLREFTEKTYKPYEYTLRPWIVCKDGFKMSVQGHSGSYSSPRNMATIYSEMEIGFPSEEEDLILEYAEDKDNPTDTVYGWVPCYIIQQVIEKHDGIDEQATFSAPSIGAASFVNEVSKDTAESEQGAQTI